MLMNTLEINHD